MITIFVRHTVADHAAWRAGYDAFDAVRRPMGVVAESVYQSVDNPNDITVTHDFDTLEAAQKFAGSTELKNTMERAGVVGQPSLWFTNKA